MDEAMTRRGFIEGLCSTAFMSAAFSGCRTLSTRPYSIGLQLYSIRDYIASVGLDRALREVAEIGYEGVEFAGYYGLQAKAIRALLDGEGLVACGTQVDASAFGPDRYRETCEFERTLGNTEIYCVGSGNFPPGVDWGHETTTPSKEVDDFIKRLCDYYNRAAEDCAKYGCRIGIHNHRWEFLTKMTDGTTFWDYFLSHTSPAVLMEQDVGWTTCVGEDPCEQYRKYPGRSVALHAKENGMGEGVTEFEGILGRPGRPGAKGVDWDALIPVALKNGIRWFTVECERGEQGLDTVRHSFAFLRGRFKRI